MTQPALQADKEGMKIIFMGTPDFAVPVLDALMQDGQQVTLVVTQPDRAKGRGREIVKTPVKLCAEKWGIPVFQPEKVKKPEAVDVLRKEAPDMIVVAAFGQILSQEILDLPRYGCVNVHASLLPRWRGAAPIQWAVIAGDKESGVSIMQMDAGLDTGAVLKQEKVTLSEKETAESLYDKLSAIGGRLLVETLPEIEKGTVTPVPQNDAESCYAKMLHKETGLIVWEKDAVTLERLIRGLYPWPGTYTHLDGRNFKILRADIAAPEAYGVRPEDFADAAPGTILGTGDGKIFVQTGNGVLAVTEVQAEGKRRMPVKDFLLGNRLEPGKRFQ